MPAKHLPSPKTHILTKKEGDRRSVYEGLKGKQRAEGLCLAGALASVCVRVCVCAGARVRELVRVCLSAQCRWVAEWLLQPNDSVC